MKNIRNSFTIVILAIVLLGGHHSALGAKTPKRMNVLFLIADDLNSWLLIDKNRYKGKVVAPNLHRFAASGVNFAQE